MSLNWDSERPNLEEGRGSTWDVPGGTLGCGLQRRTPAGGWGGGPSRWISRIRKPDLTSPEWRNLCVRQEKEGPSGTSVKRPAEDTEGPSLSPSPGNAPSEGGAGTDATAESVRRQESLVRDAEKLDEAHRQIYDGMDELLASDFLVQFHKSAQALNAADQDEFVSGVLVKKRVTCVTIRLSYNVVR